MMGLLCARYRGMDDAKQNSAKRKQMLTNKEAAPGRRRIRRVHAHEPSSAATKLLTLIARDQILSSFKNAKLMVVKVQ